MASENHTREAAEKREYVSIPAEKETSFSTFATASHAKGDVQMITTTKDKIEAYLSAGGSITSNFLALMIGCALTIFMALKSGGVAKEWEGLFWLAFYFSLVLVLFFGILTAKDEYRKYKYRKEIKKLPTTPLH